MDKKKLFKKIIGWVVYLAVLAGLIYFTPKAMSYMLDTPYPMASITSGSMWPVMKKGDMVFIKGVDSKEDINVGDIVVYKNPIGFTIHRVVSISDSKITTKGDANNVSDTPVRYEEIIGKALVIGEKPIKLPFFGYISILINKK